MCVVKTLFDSGVGSHYTKFMGNDGIYQKARFGAGCFWGVEEAFRKVEGVIQTTVGYSGGTTQNPTYEDVCSGETGHAEVIEIVSDPSIVSFDTLLDIFWKIHDPTTPDRQGGDIGAQYRSVVFYFNALQERIAREKKNNLEEAGVFGSPIVTSIEEAGPFYPAEAYHQRYLEKQGKGGVCGV